MTPTAEEYPMNAFTSDIALLRAWQHDRSAEAFHILVSRHAALVFNTSRHILRNEADAADVTQECFLSLATTPPHIERSLAGWLHRLATHHALNHLKAAKRRREREVRYAREFPETVHGELDDLMTLVDEAIDALPDDFRLPLIDHFLRQQTHQEVADGLSIPRRTATHRIHRGVEELREILRKKGVAVSGSALVAFLDAQRADAAAVPHALLETLGKQAMAGATTASPGFATPIGWPILKSGWVWAALAAVAVCGWWTASEGIGRTGQVASETAEGARTDVSLDGSISTQTDNNELSTGATQSNVSPPVTASPTPTGAVIAGRVYDAATNAGVPGVEVNVSVAGGARASVTDDRGEYRMENLPTGTAKITVGDVEGFYAVKDRKQEATLKASSVSFVDFGLKAGLFTGVSGTVANESGDPVAGAAVIAWSNAHLGGVGQKQETVSGEDGRFEIAGLEIDAKLFLKGTTSERACASVGPLRLGNEGLAGQQLVLAPLASVSGKVIDKEDRAVSHGVIVRANLKNPARETAVGYLLEGGAFTIEGLAPGAYELTVEHKDMTFTGIVPIAATVELAPGENKRDVVLVTGIPQQIASIERSGGPLRVEDPKDWGILKGVVRDASGGKPIETYSLNVKEFRFGSKRDNTQEIDNEQGKYELAVIEAQSYVLTASAHGFAPETVTIYPENFTPPVTTVDFALRESAIVAGTVVDAAGAPIAGAAVYLNTTPEELFGKLERNPGDTQTDADGNFVLDSLGNGTSRIYVIHPTYAYAWTVVDPSRAASLVPVITLTPGASITGTVLDCGKPVTGQQVFCRYPDARDLGVHMATTDASGTFLVEHVVPGYCETYVSIRTEDIGSSKMASQPLTLSEGQVGEATLQFLDGTARITGSITVNGAMPAGAVNVGIALDRKGASVSRAEVAYQDGRYRITNLPEGPAILSIGVSDLNDVRYTHRLPVRLLTDTEVTQNMDFRGTPFALNVTGIGADQHVDLVIYEGVVVFEDEGSLARLWRNKHLCAAIHLNEDRLIEMSEFPPGPHTLRAELFDHDQGKRRVLATLVYALEIQTDGDNRLHVVF